MPEKAKVTPPAETSEKTGKAQEKPRVTQLRLMLMPSSGRKGFAAQSKPTTGAAGKK